MSHQYIYKCQTAVFTLINEAIIVISCNNHVVYFLFTYLLIYRSLLCVNYNSNRIDDIYFIN